MRNILLICTVIAATGTGCDVVPEEKTPETKSLFSLWNTVDGDRVREPLDMTGLGFGDVIKFNLSNLDGSVCECDLSFEGSNSSGTYSLNSCVYVDGTGTADPGCNAANSTGTYSIKRRFNVDRLYVCTDDSVCQRYE